MPGRALRDVLDLLRLVRRRPRVKAAQRQERQTWLEVEPSQFDANEWWTVIEVVRHSYEVSADKRGLRVVGGQMVDPDAGVGVGEAGAV